MCKSVVTTLVVITASCGQYNSGRETLAFPYLSAASNDPNFRLLLRLWMDCDNSQYRVEVTLGDLGINSYLMIIKRDLK